VLDAQELTDVELLRAYKGQPAAELSFKWAKNPAAITPIFLETPTRIAALGCVYLIALLVYTLVERHVRKALTERGETLPDRPALSQRPAARMRMAARFAFPMRCRPARPPSSSTGATGDPTVDGS
jgi:transposase